MPVKGPPATPPLELVILSASDDPAARDAALDIAAAARRGGKALGVAFCAPGAEPLKGMRRVELPGACSPWGGLVSALPGSQARDLLFWPASVEADPAQLKRILGMADGKTWVLAARGEVPEGASQMQRLLGLPGGLDLGGPLLAPRGPLAGLAGLYHPGDPLLALRLVAKANAQDEALSVMDADGPVLSLAQALGIDPGILPVLKRRGIGLLIGAVLLAVGLALSYPAGIAVALFGIGLLVIGHHFGKAE